MIPSSQTYDPDILTFDPVPPVPPSRSPNCHFECHFYTCTPVVRVEDSFGPSLSHGVQ